MSKNNRPDNLPNNPYAAAAGAYDQHARKHTPDQRELEGRVLLKAAAQLQNLQSRWESVTPAELDEALTYNRKLWTMFVDTALDDADPNRPVDLRNNIANLGLYIFKRTVDILASPQKEKLNILININREVAEGLLSKVKDATSPAESGGSSGASAKK